VELDYFPNATVAEYGEIDVHWTDSWEDVAHKIRAEIYARVSFCIDLGGGGMLLMIYCVQI
jgi:hypothetical protein